MALIGRTVRVEERRGRNEEADPAPVIIIRRII